MTAQADEPLNQPEAENRIYGWHAIDWKRAYREVRRLQIRIVKAVKEGKWHKVRGLIRLLSKSFYAKAISVRRVTENRGKKTPGIDKVIWNTPKKKWDAINSLQTRGYKPMPLRRVYIPKINGKRPLSIPTMRDRAYQALFLLGLDPVSESLADPSSYGFRKERCCQDAIEQVFKCMSKGHFAQFVLEGDIRSCFSEISHEWLVKKTRFCGGIIKKWLKAGYVYRKKLFPTKTGTPQGGIASPVLANITLDGLEDILEKRYKNRKSSKVNLIRYCDDFVITGDSLEILEDVKKIVSRFLQERGLEFSEEKTSITHISDGFDFLGWNVRKFKGKLIITPAKKNVTRFMDKIRTTIKRFATAKQEVLINTLNNKIRGWSNYHKHVCSKKTFVKVDSLIWESLWRWCRRRHPKKSKTWIARRYFHSENRRRWVFGVRNTERKWIAKLIKASDIPIRRYTKIKGEVNPYDPIFEQYLETRQTRKWEQNVRVAKLRSLWKQQRGICPVCSQLITLDTGWEQHHKIRRVNGGDDSMTNLFLLHPNCHNQIHSNPNLTVG